MKIKQFYVPYFVVILCLLQITGCSKKNDNGVAPTVKITSPFRYSGNTITRIVGIKTTTGNAVTKVEFYADGQLLTGGTITKAPFNFDWTVTDKFGIGQKIMAKAYNAKGVAAIDTVTVVVWDGVEKVPMPTSRYAFTSNVVNGIIYVIGGYDSAQYVNEAYDPVADKWSEKAKPHIGHAAHASCVIDNKIYVFGGDKGYNWIPNVEAYDPATDTWADKAPIPVGYGVAFGMMGCAAYNGKAYLFGGFGPGSPTTIGEYDPVADKWTIKTTDNIFWQSAVLAAGKVYVFGGCPTGGIGDCTNALNTLQTYDPVANSFTSQANMIYNQSGQAAAVLNDKIYAMGGTSNANNTLMEMYNPAANSWKALTPLPVGAVNFSASTVSSSIYIIGPKVYQYFGQ